MSERAAVGWGMGVALPAVVGMLGASLFLRVGPVVGDGGPLGALAVFALAAVLAAGAALAAGALATTPRLGPGGAHFLISRSSGLEVGGAVGVPLFFGQALTVAWAAWGMAEVLGALGSPIPPSWVAPPLALGLVALARAGSGLPPATLVLPVGAALFAVGALLVGVDFAGPRVQGFGPWTVGFWPAFAVVFPAFSGVLTGLSFAGRLAHPERALVLGGLGAVGASLAVFAVVPGSLANARDAATLAEPGVWLQVSAWPWGTALAVLGAIAGGGAVAARAAPHTLEALALDRLAPAGFAESEAGEPTWGYLATAGVGGLGAALLGGLDGVGVAVSAMLLTAFAVIYLVAGIEAWFGDAGTRPGVRAPWALCLAGAVLCGVALVALSRWVALGALVAEIAILWSLSRRSLLATFGDARAGLLLSAARWALLELRSTRPDPRSWRPHILVVTSDLRRSMPVVGWADVFGQRRGIVAVTRLIEGDAVEDVASRLREDAGLLREAGIAAFPEVTVARELDQAIVTVAQGNGVAGFPRNAVMFGVHVEEHGPEHLARLLRLSRRLAAVEKCVILHAPGSVRPQGPARFVVWWGGRGNHGDLMLLLARLAASTSTYRRVRIELRSVADDADEAHQLRRDFDGSFPADPGLDIAVRVRAPDRSLHDVIADESAGAILVFIGLTVPEPGQEAARAVSLHALLRRLPDTCLVHNAGPFRGRLV